MNLSFEANNTFHPAYRFQIEDPSSGEERTPTPTNKAKEKKTHPKKTRLRVDDVYPMVRTPYITPPEEVSKAKGPFAI